MVSAHGFGSGNFRWPSRISGRGRESRTAKRGEAGDRPLRRAVISSLVRLHPLKLVEPLQGRLLPEQSVIDPARVQRTALLVGELIEIGEELLDLSLYRHDQPHVPG